MIEDDGNIIKRQTHPFRAKFIHTIVLSMRNILSSNGTSPAAPSLRAVSLRPPARWRRHASHPHRFYAQLPLTPAPSAAATLRSVAALRNAPVRSAPARRGSRPVFARADDARHAWHPTRRCNVLPENSHGQRAGQPTARRARVRLWASIEPWPSSPPPSKTTR